MSKLSNHIKAELAKGTPIQAIADELDCSIEDVERHLQEDSSSASPTLLISETGEIITPGRLYRYGSQDFVDPVTGKARLEEELRVTAGCILRQVQAKISVAESAKELALLAGSVATLQNAFFSRPSTVIVPTGPAAENPLIAEMKKRLKS